MDYMFGNQECSSGGESGWTLYLQHSSISPDASYDRQHDSPDSRGNRVFTKEDEEDEEDEDLSMVSDASSGPPHLHEEEGYGGGNEKNGYGGGFYPYAAIDELPSSASRNINNIKKKTRENRKLQQHSSLLDDTASSPFLDFCNKTTSSQTSVENAVEYSQGYSTTQFEVRPPYQEEHYDYFQSGNQLQQQNHRWFEGKRW